MTEEEKKKAIDVLKMSAPVIPMTQEEFNDYIKTRNKIMDWIEQDIKSIPYLMHKEMDIPLSECQKAYDVAIDYLRSQGKLKGEIKNDKI